MERGGISQEDKKKLREENNKILKSVGNQNEKPAIEIVKVSNKEIKEDKEIDKKKKRKKSKKKKKKADEKLAKKKKDSNSESDGKEEEEEKKKKEMKEKQDIIADNYVMLMEMGKGAFGQIFLTYNMMEGEEVATKKEVKKVGKTSAPQLKMEFIVYKTLLHIIQPNQVNGEFQLDFSGKTRIMQEDVQGVSKFYGYGECSDYYYLIMQLLGPNLVELFNYCGNRKFTVSTVCMLAIQMLNRIEYFHKHHYLHRDIKPENFLIGCGDKSNIVYLIDFGLCKKYKDPKTHQHIPYREGRLLTGTARYVSINTHLGIEQSRRDDLESIGYVLVFFLKGSLPWQGLKTNIDKYNKIMEKKLQIPTEILCYGLPDEIAYYLNYCKSLRFEDRPDYDYLRGLFVKLLYSCISTYSLTKENLKFDWCYDEPTTIWTIFNKKKGNVPAINNKKKEEDKKDISSLPGLVVKKKSSLSIIKAETKKKFSITSLDKIDKIEEIQNKFFGEDLTPDGNNMIDISNNNFAKTNENNPQIIESDNHLSESNYDDSIKSDETVKKEITLNIGQLTKMSDKELLDLVNHNNSNNEDIDVYVNKLIIKNRNKHKKAKIIENSQTISINNSSNNQNSYNINIQATKNKGNVILQHKNSVEIIRSHRNEPSDNTIEIRPNNNNFKNISQYVNSYSDSNDDLAITNNKKLSSDNNLNLKISSINSIHVYNPLPTLTKENKLQKSTTCGQSPKTINQHLKANAIILAHSSSLRKKSTIKNDNDLNKSSATISPRGDKQKSPIQKIFQEADLNERKNISVISVNNINSNSIPNLNNERNKDHMLTFKNVDNNTKLEEIKLKQIQPPVDTSVEAALRKKKSLNEVKDSTNNLNDLTKNEILTQKVNKLSVINDNNFLRQKSFEENVMQKTSEISKERRKSKIIDINSNPHIMKFSKDQMIKISNEPIQKYYGILGELGHGSYGSVKKVKHKQLGEERAMKIVKKKSESSQNEIDILKKISHPNIISIYEIFEDSKNFYIMSELLEGGELFEVITTQGSFSEIDAAKIMKQILNSVNYLHNKSIVHRDLKPENIMLINKNTINNNNYEIKIIDFGTAKQFERNQKLSKFIGTSYYIAPEVLAECYDEKCDVWSCGVILYILLCGYPPFNGASNIDIYHAIKYNPVNFSSDEWKYVHKDGIDLIKQMLNKNPIKRFSAEMCLNHRWFKSYDDENNTASKKESKSTLNINAINKMKDFVSQNKLKQAVLQYISVQFNLKEEEENLRELFKQFDTHRKGVINISDFTTILVNIFGENDGKLNAEMIFQNIDLDGSGEISYNEFITALIDGRSLITQDRLERAFKMFDKDNSGTISVDEIRSIFGGDEYKWKKIINEVDLNGDGEIDFEEFKVMMKGLEEKEMI